MSRNEYYALVAAIVIFLIILLIVWHQREAGESGGLTGLFDSMRRGRRAHLQGGGPTQEPMMAAAQWSQAGSGQTWGKGAGEAFSARENMSVGAHWDSDGSYGHTAATLPAFSLSGYTEEVPTTSWS